MTWYDWTLFIGIILFCCTLPGLCVMYRVRGIRIHSAHRSSQYFPEPGPFLCTDLILKRRPMAHPAANRSWCTDCGWAAGHAADCPRLTGQTCPQCSQPKRSRHVCYHCGFYGFVVTVNLSRHFSKQKQRARKLE